MRTQLKQEIIELTAQELAELISFAREIERDKEMGITHAVDHRGNLQEFANGFQI